ncbi:MAG TPA: hypothetical protein VNZ86_05565 [Bacteroidia bacterium]|jgi:hypothetical protein|nr:hypothetical protein [Bacteroidia bacterium]
MKKNSTQWITGGFSALLMLSLAFGSCKKSTNNTPASEETATSSDNALAEHTVSDLTEMAAQASDGSSGLSSYRVAPGYDPVLALGCATVGFNAAAKVDTITFNNTMCMDGITRNGKLIIDWSASASGATHYRDPGFSCNVSSVNYTVNGMPVNIISKTVTNTTPVGFNPATTDLTWSINANISIAKSTGTFTWICNRTKTLLNTSDTSVYHGSARAISWAKARVGITGSANGNTATGLTYTATITNQLIRDFGGCNISGQHPFIKGTIQFTPNGHPTRTIDYGNGSCDLIYTVTVSGNTYTFTLP